MAYNKEAVMAEKVETILRHSIFNNSPRDFYDAYISVSTQKFEKFVFTHALRATAPTAALLNILIIRREFCTTLKKPPTADYVKNITGILPMRMIFTYEQIMDAVRFWGE